MEKYSKWRDPGTGIAPFLPIVPPKVDKRGSFTVYLLVKRFLVGPILVLVRAPIILILGLFAIILYKIPISLIHRWLLALVLRLQLFFAGFYWIPLNPGSLKRGIQSSTSSSPRDGDVIFCNSSSYLDAIILQIKFNPVFTLAYSDSGMVDEVSIDTLLRSYSGVVPPNSKSSSQSTLAALSSAVAKRKGGPIVVFFEGTTTNGRGILAPIAGLLEGFSKSFYLVHIRYPSVHYSPTLPIGSIFWHVVGLCSQIKNSATLRMVSSPEVQCNLKPNEPMANQVVSLLARMSGLRSMSLNIVDKRRFAEYFYSSLKSN